MQVNTLRTPETTALTMLSEVSQCLIGPEPFQAQIDTALQSIGQHLQVSRAYIFLDSTDGSTTSNAFEWCHEGIASQISGLQNIPYATIPSWRRMLHENGRVFSEDIQELPKDVRTILEPQGIRSLIVYPLHQGKEIFGFVGFDECVRKREWSPVELEVLCSLSGILSAALQRKQLQEREQKALRKFSSFFANNPAPMVISSFPERRILEVNEAFISKLGYERSELIGRTSTYLGYFTQPAQQLMLQQALEKYGHVQNMELEIRCKSGKKLHGLLSGELLNDFGKISSLLVLIDITPQIELSQLLSQERLRLEQIIASTQLGTWEWNISDGHLILNDRWASICGYTLSELQPISIDTWTQLAHPDDLNISELALQRHFRKETEYYECECRVKHRDGHWVWVLDRGKVIQWNPDGTPQLMFGTHTDISVHKAMEEKIREAAIRDPLTNIYNRRFFFDQLQICIAETERTHIPFSIAILDIDFFKHINDQHGHPAGDQVLIDFTRIIAGQIRAYDLLGRYGGEEFIILFRGIGEQTALERVRHILDTVRSAIIYHNSATITFTFSAGVVGSDNLPSQQYSLETLIDLADQRLYFAKNQGRNRVNVSQ